MVDRKTALEVVVSCLKDVVEQAGEPAAAPLNENTVLVGPGAVIDSLGVVALIVDIEQKLEMDHDTSVTLADDKAMSAKNSPFRTAGVLADHIINVAKGGHAS